MTAAATVKENPMRIVRLEKVVVNMAVGKPGDRLQKSADVLKELTGGKPTFRKARDTIREFGIREGENISTIVTLRGAPAREFLQRALEAVGKKLRASSFDDYGNVSFGLKEHIDIPGARYEPELGIFGMDVTAVVTRAGYRVARRRRERATIPRNHRVSGEEASEFLRREFGIQLVGA